MTTTSMDIVSNAEQIVRLAENATRSSNPDHTTLSELFSAKMAERRDVHELVQKVWEKLIQEVRELSKNHYVWHELIGPSLVIGIMIHNPTMRTRDCMERGKPCIQLKCYTDGITIDSSSDKIRIIEPIRDLIVERLAKQWFVSLS